MKIRNAAIEDLKYIVDLSKKESHAIGFIPKPAYEAAITGEKFGKRWSKTCNDMLYVCEENSDLVGFVLASFGFTPKINQICIQEDARLLERGEALLKKVINYGESINRYEFSCGCADDLESNVFWKAMGFDKVAQRKGISHNNTWFETSDRLVNIYRFISKNDPQLKLFT